MRRTKLYVLVRKDLSYAQRAVQGGHAIAQYLLENPATGWDNGTLVFLGVKGECQLKNWAFKLRSNDVRFSQFCEPDIDNQLTAIAAVSNGDHFDKLNLLV